MGTNIPTDADQIDLDPPPNSSRSSPETIARCQSVKYASTGEQEKILRDAAKSAERWLSGVDLLYGLLFLRLLPIAATEPPEIWPSKAAKVSKGILRFFRRLLQQNFYSRIPQCVVEYSGVDREAIGLQQFTKFVLSVIEALAASLGRPMPTSTVQIRGTSHIQAALDKGRGVVLWNEPCFSSSLWNKAALAGAGFRVHHVSRPEHNFSPTRFGIQYVNRISRKAEDRYLAERILMTNSRRVVTSRRIIDHLNGNNLVSMTATQEGAQVISTPALGGEVRLATGAPSFSLRAHAPLVPVFSFRDNTGYVVEAQEPIEMSGSNRQMEYQSAVKEYARRLESYVREHPADWFGWDDGCFSDIRLSGSPPI